MECDKLPPTCTDYLVITIPYFLNFPILLLENKVCSTKYTKKRKFQQREITNVEKEYGRKILLSQTND